MPLLVARLILCVRVVAAPYGSVVGDIADGSEVNPLARLAERHMFGFRIAKSARKSQVGLIGHRLFGEAEQGEFIHRPIDGLNRFIVQRTRQIDTENARPELRVQRFRFEFSHAIPPRPFFKILAGRNRMGKKRSPISAMETAFPASGPAAPRGRGRIPTRHRS